MIDDMETALAEAGRSPLELYDMTFFDFERIIEGYEHRQTAFRQTLGWFTLCLMQCHTKKARFDKIMEPFKKRKSGEELMRDRAELYREFGRAPDGSEIKR